MTLSKTTDLCRLVQRKGFYVFIEHAGQFRLGKGLLRRSFERVVASSNSLACRYPEALSELIERDPVMAQAARICETTPRTCPWATLGQLVILTVRQL